MRNCSIVIFVIIAIASPVRGQHWQAEPSALFGIAFGATPNQVPRELRTAPCGTNYCHIKVPMHGTLEVFDIGFDLAGTLFFTDRGFQSAEFEVPNYEFDFMKNALEVRYGPPTKSENPVITTRLGEEFRSQLISWEGEERYIRLSRALSVYTSPTDRVPTGKLLFGSKSVDRLQEERIAAAIKSAAAKF